MAGEYIVAQHKGLIALLEHIGGFFIFSRLGALDGVDKAGASGTHKGNQLKTGGNDFFVHNGLSFPVVDLFLLRQHRTIHS